MPSRSRRNTDDSASRFDRRRSRVLPTARRRLRADPLAAATRALRAALAADRRRPARAVALARRAEHDRELVRRRDVPTRDPGRDRGAVHPHRAPALLDRHLAAVGSKYDPGAAAGTARTGAARGELSARSSATRKPKTPTSNRFRARSTHGAHASGFPARKLEPAMGWIGSKP